MDDSEDLVEVLREKEEEKIKYEKELQQQNIKINDFREKIAKKVEEIQSLQKEIGAKSTAKHTETNKMKKETTMITLEEQILKLFSKIQQQCQSNLQEKYKVKNIERLLSQQKELRITYIIIKKLEIKEEFYTKHKITEVQNLFENLKSLSKNGILNYSSLKECGPYLIFRLTSDSIFNDIKEKSCSIWGVPMKSFSLYDDTFNNMECTMDSKIQEYFSFYQPTDNTLPVGHACFYLVEKLKQQTGLLSIQEKIINKENVDDNQGGNNFAGADLDNCIQKLTDGEILKGLKKYHVEPYDYAKEFKKVVNAPENNIIFVVLTILLIILSFVAVCGKNRSIEKWSQVTQKNALCVDEFFNPSALLSTSVPTLSEYCKGLVNLVSESNNLIKNYGFRMYGLSQIRIFKGKKKDCFSGEETINSNYQAITEVNCFERDYSGSHKNKEAFKGFQYSDKLDITHTYNTYTGKFDKTGVALRFNQANLSTVQNLFDSNDDFSNVIAVELQFNFYDPGLDIFVANGLLIQNENGKPIVTQKHTIPFLTNVYENNRDIYRVDIVRIIITLILLLTIILNIFLKYRREKSKSAKNLIVLIINSILKIKSLLLIFSTAFISTAFAIFIKHNLDSNDHNTQTDTYIDFLGYAMDQKRGRYFDQLAFFIIFLYTLKYLQFFERINVLITVFKKAAFEILLLTITVIFLILGLSFTSYFVYGSYIKDYSTFNDSIITNIKVILFLENTNIISELDQKFRGFSILLLIVFILILRFFVLNLFYPVIIEYLRIETDKISLSRNLGLEGVSFCDKFRLIVYSIFSFNKEEKEIPLKKKKVDEKDINVEEFLGDSK